MMKSVYHIFLAVIILLSGMNYSLVQVHFHINRAEIAAAFCENKEKLELNCNGSCELDRRLSDTQEKQEEKDKIFLEEFQFLYLKAAQFAALEKPFLSVRSDLNANRIQLAIFEIQLDFFHPPKHA